MRFMNHSYRWSFRKFAINLFSLAAIISIGTFCFAIAVSGIQIKKTRTITVKPGDTLWKLAVRIAPNDDPRNTITKIKALNNLNKSDLKIGQNLKVEIEE